MIYNSNVDHANDNVYTKFGLNWSIRFHDIEKKNNSAVNQGPLLCCKFAEILTHQDFSHYKFMGIFPDTQGQLAQQSMVGSGLISNTSMTLWLSSLTAKMNKIR